jgi:beta-glucosidase/6-phospho-beta-glucosidase/beta-galactosidase
MIHYQARPVLNPGTQRFLFATGIECSYPTIETPNGRLRRDQMAECRHYERWRDDLQLVREMEIRYLRYGPPYYRMHLGPDHYDWAWTDAVLPEMRRLGIVPLLDLCHFGVPDWAGNFQNEDWPALFAAYAGAFARRYPWVRFYTPVNEMYITAEFSGYYGWWNERLQSHHGFVTALKNVARANVLAMRAIREVRPDALFILCESSEHTHPSHPDLVDEAELFNERRFLTLDLTCGRHVNAGMYAYLRDNGMTESEYLFFFTHNLREHCIVGHDYYVTNEYLLVDEERREFAGDILGYYAVAWSYHDRYRLPVMHTETNRNEPDALAWLWKTWANIRQLRHDGVPLIGMTWYSLTDQVDWDTALREKNDRVNPLGLFDLDRNIRPVGRAYKRLIQQWGHLPLLPGGPLTLCLPGAEEQDPPPAEPGSSIASSQRSTA